MLSALKALELLEEGNRRFVSNDRGRNSLAGRRCRAELLDGQDPIAIVLGCSDSRVPAELVFDQGLGDLFVIRVAGNVVAPSQIASIEFAAERFGTRLVVVLGHSRCGAVEACLEELRRPEVERSPNLRSIVDRIRPAVEPLLERPELQGDTEILLRTAIRANIEASAEQVIHGSEIIGQLQDDGLLVVAAEYSLESGAVDFFEGASVGNVTFEK